MTTNERRTVAVIGGGFSGLMTALHLAQALDGPTVRLVERHGEAGRGLAYQRRSAEHLLNVRASNMSAWPDRPRDFADWYAARGGEDTAFASRGLYGDYLGELLAAQRQGADAERLSVEVDAAVAMRRDHDRWMVTLAGGGEIAADVVVLALGNLPPRPPARLGQGVEAAAAYIADPWDTALDAAPEAGLVVLIGTGLTMIDVTLRLARRRPGLRFLAVSRKGLLPHVHLPLGPTADAWTPREALSPLAILREARRRVRQGAEWRAVVDGLRARARALWRSWSSAERQRFLRHLRGWWDVHRHRVAPQVAAELEALRAGGALEVRSGRLERIETAEGGLEVAWRPAGGADVLHTRAALVVNCTGPDPDLGHADEPLIASLVRQDLVRADPLRLGLETDDADRLVRADGAANATLFAVGPVTRGAFWEITAVPDIRGQAAECAAHVMAALAREPASS